jgi:hypothetical protein
MFAIAAIDAVVVAIVMFDYESSLIENEHQGRKGTLTTNVVGVSELIRV